MFDVMFGTLFQLITTPYLMGLMVIAVAIGIFVGATPGIGGRLSIALVIPFVFGMDMIPGAIFLLTMHAVNGTSGQISSIMFGIPGDGDDAATTIDGYPLAKQGRAGEAAAGEVGGEQRRSEDDGRQRDPGEQVVEMAGPACGGRSDHDRCMEEQHLAGGLDIGRAGDVGGGRQ